MTTTTTRPIRVIAQDIKANWPNVNYAAQPYLEAMENIEDIADDFFQDSARSVVLYFLSNAKTWRGDAARRIKAELKAMLK